MHIIRIYNDGDAVYYGDNYDAGDVIGICLDMRLKGKYSLTFSKNGSPQRTLPEFQQSADYNYRFAVSIDTEDSRIEIIDFAIVE